MNDVKVSLVDQGTWNIRCAEWIVPVNVVTSGELPFGREMSPDAPGLIE